MKKIFLTSLVLSFILSPLTWSKLAQANMPGAYEYALANSIGGGPGYNSMIDPTDADYTVTSLIELEDALNMANDGDILYVASDIQLPPGHGQWSGSLLTKPLL